MSAYTPQGEVGIEIADTGVGLSAAQRAELFRPFNPLGAERSAVEGAGLGLVLSRHLVELMGSRITMHSAPGVGSTFGIVLPATATATAITGGDDAAAAGLGPAPDADHAATEAAGHVLYVEDNPVNALLMETLLSRRPQVTLHVAEDGRAALEQALRQRRRCS